MGCSSYRPRVAQAFLGALDPFAGLGVGDLERAERNVVTGPGASEQSEADGAFGFFCGDERKGESDKIGLEGHGAPRRQGVGLAQPWNVAGGPSAYGIPGTGRILTGRQWFVRAWTGPGRTGSRGLRDQGFVRVGGPARARRVLGPPMRSGALRLGGVEPEQVVGRDPERLRQRDHARPGRVPVARLGLGKLGLPPSEPGSEGRLGEVQGGPCRRDALAQSWDFLFPLCHVGRVGPRGEVGQFLSRNFRFRHDYSGRSGESRGMDTNLTSARGEALTRGEGAGGVRRITLSQSQVSAMECRDWSEEPMVRECWHGRTLFVPVGAVATNQLYADLTDAANAEDAQAETHNDKRARSAARSLGTVARKVLLLASSAQAVPHA